MKTHSIIPIQHFEKRIFGLLIKTRDEGVEEFFSISAREDVSNFIPTGILAQQLLGILPRHDFRLDDVCQEGVEVGLGFFAQMSLALPILLAHGGVAGLFNLLFAFTQRGLLTLTFLAFFALFTVLTGRLVAVFRL